MTKHEAVDRLMELATEKRADRVPPVPASAAKRGEAESQALAPSPATGPQLSAVETRNAASLPVPTVNRGRQILQTIRPLLPAIAGAMRLVDHGAVQAAARFLPLLGGTPVANSPSAAASAATAAAQEQFAHAATELEAAHGEVRRQLSALQLQTLAADEQIARMRTQLERLTSEQLSAKSETRKLAQRARLLTAGTIILLMLVIAQMIVLILSMHG